MMNRCSSEGVTLSSFIIVLEIFSFIVIFNRLSFNLCHESYSGWGAGSLDGTCTSGVDMESSLDGSRSLFYDVNMFN